MKVVQTDVSCLESTQTPTRFFKPAWVIMKVFLALFYMQNIITPTKTLW